MSFANYSVILKAQKIGTAEIPFSEHLEPKEDSVKNRNYASIGIIPNTLDIRTISVQKSSILGSVIASAITKGFRANCPLAFIRPLQGVCLCVPLTLCDIFQYISEHTGT